MCLSRLAQILYAVVCALVVCFILVSTFTTEWTVGKVTAIDRSMSRHDRTVASRGLLRMCVLDICTEYDREYVPDWLNGVLACMIMALIVAVGAFIWDCITFGACCCRDYLLQPLPVLASLCALLLCIAVIIYGVKDTEEVGKAQDSREWEDTKETAKENGFNADVGFGYSFYMAIVAIILSLINVVIGALGLCCADKCEPI